MSPIEKRVFILIQWVIIFIYNNQIIISRKNSKYSVFIDMIKNIFFLLKNAAMGRMFHTESVSNAKVCVRTAHLVIYLQVDVMTGVVITGLESFVKVF